jgi:hypothetical protein
MEAETKLSHLPGPGGIQLREGMLAELGQHRLQLLHPAQALGFPLAAKEVPSRIKGCGEAVGIAELPI